jgi:pimeloyl-ACP methyl ester carboxylesterase
VISTSAEAIRDHLIGVLGGCTASEPVAAAVELGIRNEVAVRRALASAVNIGAAVIRPTTTTPDRPPARVTDIRDIRHSERERVRPTTEHTSRPVVHWHRSGEGPPLLLLNGWTASGLAWPHAWLRRLEEAYDVIRIDNRGTGWSRSAPTPFTIVDLADDARDVLRASGIDRASVLGISMGGMIAQELAIRHRDAVERLVLAATRPPTPAHTPMSRAALRLAMSRPQRDQPRREFVISTWAQTTGDGFVAAHPEALNELGDQVMRRITPRSGRLNQMRAIMSWRGPQRLSRVAAPATVVHGDQDPLIDVDNGRRLAQLIPSAHYVELSGVGHLVAHEAGDVLIAALSQ